MRSYDNAQEPEMTREEAITEKQYQIADRLKKEIRGDNNAATIAVINHISAELSDEDYELLARIVEEVINYRFEYRYRSINMLVNNAIEAQALALAKQEYPGVDYENN